MDRTPRIIRTARDRAHPYQIINTAFARDARLSVEARGVMVSLLCKPDWWQIRPDALARELGLGRDKTYRILRELADAGYLARERSHDARGRIVWGDYVLFENPAEAPRPENPDMDMPDPAEPDTENQDMGDCEEFPVRTPSTPLPGLPYLVNQDAHVKNRREYKTEEQGTESPPPPTPSRRASRAAGGTEPPRGGGGGIGRSSPAPHPETITWLSELPGAARVALAASCGDIPLAVAQAAYQAVRETPNPGARLYGLLKKYRSGEWAPAALEESAPRRISDRLITLAPGLSPQERGEWLGRYRAARDETGQRAILAQFQDRYPAAAAALGG